MIGVDLVYIPEFKSQLSKGGKIFLDKAFSLSEQKDSRPEHLAGLWAAKEAVTKAGNLKPGKWLDIVLGRSPFVAKVDGASYEYSISHHGDYAIAVAIKKGR